jgi:hypothetical protein
MRSHPKAAIALQLILGFAGPYCVTTLLGLLTVWLGPKVAPGMLSAWGGMTALQKGVVVGLVDSPWLVLVVFLWRRQQFVSWGIILYLAHEALLVLIAVVSR